MSSAQSLERFYELTFVLQCDFDCLQVVSFNSDMTEFTVTGSQVSEVENILRQVTYVNARSYPTPGRRNLRIDTTITSV